MRHRVGATYARTHFGELLRRVAEEGECIVVERRGKPQVVVISVAEYGQLVAAWERQEEWRQLVKDARERVRADLAGRDLTPPEELIRDMREARDRQLLDSSG